MASRTYATPSDYARFAEVDFDGGDEQLTKRLRSASIEVEKQVRYSRFYTDVDGYPTDTDVSDAFTEATCAIAEHWSITDDPTGAEAAAGAIKIGSVSLGTTSSNQAAESPREKLERRIGAKGVTILANAGLLSAVVSY